MTPPEIVSIAGQPHPFCYLEEDENAHRTGIVTRQQTFWMEPLCRRAPGSSLHPLPRIPPIEIEEVTFGNEAPPAQFLARLEREAGEAREHFAGTSVEDYARVTKQPLTEQNRAEIAQELGRLQKISPDEAKANWFENEAQFPYFNLKIERAGASDSEVWQLVHGIRFLAHYADGTRIYLTALQAAPHSRKEADGVRSRFGSAVPEAAADATANASDTQTTSLAAQMAKLLPKVEKLVVQQTQQQATSQKETENALREILAENKASPVDLEIRNFYWLRNFSQDRIVEELKKQGRGKSKTYVGRVIRSVNQQLEAKNFRGKYRVTGSALPEAHAFEGDGDDSRIVPVNTETPATILEGNERQGIIERWPKHSPEDQKCLLEEYPDLEPELRRKGMLDEKLKRNRKP